MGEAELHKAGRGAGEDEARAQAERADHHRHHDAEAVGEAAHEDAADAEADHRERIGQGSVAARGREIRLHQRQRHPMLYMPAPPIVMTVSAAQTRTQAYVDSGSLFTGS